MNHRSPAHRRKRVKSSRQARELTRRHANELPPDRDLDRDREPLVIDREPRR